MEISEFREVLLKEIGYVSSEFEAKENFVGFISRYLCNIPGFMLAKIYNHYEGRLLEGNVRSFLQARGKVKKGIINTIQNEPDMILLIITVLLQRLKV